MKKINSFSFKVLTIIFTVGLLCQSCKKDTTVPDANKTKYILPDSLAKTLTFDTIKTCPLTNAIILSGKVAFNDDNVVKIYPMVSGNIQNIKVMLGDYVQKDQVLGIIKSSEMAGYSNDLVNAETGLRVAKKNLDATQDMFNSGLASQKDLLAAQAANEQAKSELNRVKSVLHINGGSANGDYFIHSPISGFVVEKLVTNGMTIRTDNSNNLFTIADLKNVWVLANVYESNINSVHLNDKADVITLSYPGKIFKGKIDKIMNVLDQTNKVMKVRIVLPNHDYMLKPEMFTSVTITDKEDHDVLCVPSSAIVFDHSQNYVLFYNNNTDIKIIPVQIINTVGNNTYISGNVKVGNKVIASQTILIYNALNS